jgi:small subunit ribosomal protein S18
MAKAAPKRGKNKDNARRSKKKISVLTQEKVEYVDYKDVNLLRRFMSDRAKIRARRVTGNDSQQQKEIARAIKNAREMALLPYTNRVTTQRGGGRGGRDRDGDGDRGDRGDRRDRGPRRGESETTLATAENAPAPTPTGTGAPSAGSSGGNGNGSAEVTA